MNNIDRKSRKTLIVYAVLHPKCDDGRLYMNRKQGGRGLMIVEMCAKG